MVFSNTLKKKKQYRNRIRKERERGVKHGYDRGKNVLFWLPIGYCLLFFCFFVSYFSYINPLLLISYHSYLQADWSFTMFKGQSFLCCHRCFLSKYIWFRLFTSRMLVYNLFFVFARVVFYSINGLLNFRPNKKKFPCDCPVLTSVFQIFFGDSAPPQMFSTLWWIPRRCLRMQEGGRGKTRNVLALLFTYAWLLQILKMERA